MKRVNAEPAQASYHDELLLLLGEELKQSLVLIAQLAELGDKEPLIRAQSQKALNTIDNVMLYKRCVSGQLSLQLEPVHVGSTIAQVAQSVAPQMKMNGYQTRLIIGQSLGSVDVDRQLFSGALLSLWQACIANAHNVNDITCSAQRIRGGVRVSLFYSTKEIEGFSLAQTNIHSRQPISAIAGPATDLLTARGLFTLTGANLTKSRSSGLTGFGVTVPFSHQLHLV